MTNPIDALLAEKGVLLADGATGTNLFAMGLEAGEAPELWNETAPEKIAALHQNFVDAGADIILTNSFGGTRHRLKLHHAQDRVHELNKRAAEIARAVADKAGRKVIVAGSVGPTGELLEPLGAMTYERGGRRLRRADRGPEGRRRRGRLDRDHVGARRGEGGGRGRDQGRPALHLHRLLRHGRPHDDGPRAQGHPWRRPTGLPKTPVAVGANCGVGASDILSSLLDMTAAKPDATIIVKGNCGIPEFRGTEIHYSGTPELMSDYVRLAVDGGAKIVGGCCGTSFAHLAAMRKALDAHVKGERPTVETIVRASARCATRPPTRAAARARRSEARRERRRRA